MNDECLTAVPKDVSHGTILASCFSLGPDQTRKKENERPLAQNIATALWRAPGLFCGDTSSRIGRTDGHPPTAAATLMDVSEMDASEMDSRVGLLDAPPWSAAVQARWPPSA